MVDRGYGGFHDYVKVGEMIFPSDTEKNIICEGITGIRNKSGASSKYLVEGGAYEKLKEIVLPNRKTG